MAQAARKFDAAIHWQMRPLAAGAGDMGLRTRAKANLDMARTTETRCG
ncbi:MAG: hypothetical protein ACJAVR_004102 [Paracoccaceae bacterium]|jgi:hypothetical protein